MTEPDGLALVARPRRPLSGGAIAVVVVAGVALVLALCLAGLFAVSAAYDARSREVHAVWTVQHFERGPADEYGSRSCRPVGPDVHLAEGTRLVLTDTDGRRMAVGRIEAGLSLGSDSCIISGFFPQRVALRETYLLRMGSREPIAVHPDRDDLCDPDQDRYPDSLTLESHPPVGCG